MCRLFETIRIENGIPQNLEWHEKRMILSRKSLWGTDEPVILRDVIHPPVEMRSGIVRCNVQYGKSIQSVTFSHYEKKQIRTLKLVDGGSLDYSMKYSDRSSIDLLFALRESCDEIILVKEGHITDTSISNIIFFDGKHWYTPHKPILNGTCRQRLLASGSIHEAEITVSGFTGFRGLKLINAMRSPREETIIPVSAIIF